MRTLASVGFGLSDAMQLSDEEKKRRRTRSIAIACALAGIVVLFYLVTIVRLGSNVMNRPF